MARLILTIAALEAGQPASTLDLSFAEELAIDRADYLRRLMGQWRSPYVTLRDAGGGEVCRIDMRRLTRVQVVAADAAPTSPT